MLDFSSGDSPAFIFATLLDEEDTVVLVHMPLEGDRVKGPLAHASESASVDSMIVGLTDSESGDVF